MNAGTASVERRIGLRGLFGLHLVLAWNIGMMLGPGAALAQAFFPPVLPLQFARIAVHLPDFTLLCLPAAAVILLLLHAVSKRAVQSFSP